MSKACEYENKVKEQQQKLEDNLRKYEEISKKLAEKQVFHQQNPERETLGERNR